MYRVLRLAVRRARLTSVHHYLPRAAWLDPHLCNGGFPRPGSIYLCRLWTERKGLATASRITATVPLTHAFGVKGAETAA